MLHSTDRPAASAAKGPGFTEFVALIALMMGTTAFSIDNLLPAFDKISADFALANPNDVQMLVSFYLVGIALSQLVYGTVSDTVGRRRSLIFGLAIFLAGTLLALFSQDFSTLLVARAIQGIGAGAGRVLAVAIVRDRFEGRDMARVMSLSMMVFLTVPILAPAIGSLILLFGGWHLVFIAMLVINLALAVWFWVRMPETLHPEFRVPFSLASIARGIGTTLTARRPMGYATAMGLMMGPLMAYVGSASQVFATSVYHLGDLFTAVFAAVAAVMALASFVNASLVRRLGMRRLSHAGVIGYVLVSAAMVAAAVLYDGVPPLLLYCVLIAIAQFLFAITVPNFNSMAMEPLGAIAGTASSFFGCYTMAMGALLGLAVGRAFDGTVLPLSLGYLVLGIAALALVLVAERGRLFVPHTPHA